MRSFAYTRAASVPEALAALARGARPIGGGTNLVDLMREDLESPESLVDVRHLGTDTIAFRRDAIVVGAGVTNTDLAAHPKVRQALPFVSQAVVSGASGQIRNMATVAGNLMQRSRCSYFYDHTAACNKRDPGAGCSALGGYARGHAILGTSGACISAHPSDLCVPLVALDAVVHLVSPRGERSVPLERFHLEPGATPERETVCAPDELITAIEIPRLEPGYRSAYRKVRDRASYAFALVSVAGAVRLDGDRVADVRLALGGVGTRPWRARVAEDLLRGFPATQERFRAAALAELEAARTVPDNAFKVGLAERTIIATLRSLTRPNDDGPAAGAAA